MMILPCDNQVSTDRQDTELRDKLRAEAPGIFLRMARARQRLYSRGRFELPATSVERVEQFTTENNHAAQWYLEQTHQGMKLQNPKYELPEDLQPDGSHFVVRTFRRLGARQRIPTDKHYQVGHEAHSLRGAESRSKVGGWPAGQSACYQSAAWRSDLRW